MDGRRRRPCADGVAAWARGMRARRRTKAERLQARSDVRGLVRLLGEHDWLVDRDGVARDLAVGRRLQAVTALGALDGPEAENGVVLALEDDDPRLRRAAVEELGPTPGSAAATALAKAAATWREAALAGARAAAIETLVALDDEALAVVFARTLLDTAGARELGADEQLALRRLFAIEPGGAAEVFAEQLADELSTPDATERLRLGQVLAALGHVGVDALVRTLRDPVRRHAACTALGRSRDARAVPSLVGLLDDPDPSVRAVAAEALGSIRDPEALGALIDAAGDGDPDVRDAALDALDRLGSVLDVFGGAALADALDKRVEDLEHPGDPSQANGVAPRAPRPSDHRTLLRRLLGG